MPDEHTMSEVIEAEAIMGWSLNGYQRRLMLLVLNAPERIEVRAGRG